MEKYEKIKKMLCEELDEFEKKGKLTAGDLESVYKLTKTVNNLLDIIEKEDEGGASGNYSGYGSGARRRDSMGRYTSGRRGRSREDGRSYMASRIDDLMDEAQTSEEREILSHARSRLENMM